MLDPIREGPRELNQLLKCSTPNLIATLRFLPIFKQLLVAFPFLVDHIGKATDVRSQLALLFQLSDDVRLLIPVDEMNKFAQLNHRLTLPVIEMPKQHWLVVAHSHMHLTQIEFVTLF